MDLRTQWNRTCQIMWLRGSVAAPLIRQDRAIAFGVATKGTKFFCFMALLCRWGVSGFVRKSEQLLAEDMC